MAKVAASAKVGMTLTTVHNTKSQIRKTCEAYQDDAGVFACPACPEGY